MSQKFRVGVAAKTVDGREIKAEWIKSAAEKYDPDVYGARINLEHMRSFLPDGAFKALGDVLSVDYKEEKVGDTVRPVIYAELEPTDELIAMNKNGQKVYTSMELQSDFPENGDFYLVGLAVTDSPASMGTQRLAFSAANETNNMVGSFELSELIDDSSEHAPDDFSIADKIQGIFSKFKKASVEKNNDIEFSLEFLANHLAENVSELSGDFDKKFKEQKAEIDALRNQVSKIESSYSSLKDDHESLLSDLNKIPKFSRRPIADGGNSESIDY